MTIEGQITYVKRSNQSCIKEFMVLFFRKYKFLFNLALIEVILLAYFQLYEFLKLNVFNNIIIYFSVTIFNYF